MKILITTILCCITIQTWAQDILFVNAPTVAYKDSQATQKMGIYTQGTQITSFEKVNNKLYKVLVDYQDPMYLNDIKNLSTKYKERESIASPAPIIDEDEFYAAPHLFTTVAGLKVREYPSSTSSVLGIVLNGTVVPLPFFPADKEAWIPIANSNGNGYIQAKFLGQRPDLDELITAYKYATDAQEQKKYAERVLELGWNSAHYYTIQALDIFVDYAKNNNLMELAEINQLKKQALEAAPIDGDSSKVRKLQKKQQFGFTINNIVEPLVGFDGEVVKQYIGYPLESYSDLDDCALDDYEGNALYNSAEFITHDLSSILKARKMDMINFNGFKIGQHLLNGETTEKDFLKTAKGLIGNISPLDKSYTIYLDERAYLFVFQNGLLSRVELIYYC